MLAGLWRQSDFTVYDIHDLLEVNRVLDVHQENQRRAAKATEEAAQRR